MKFRKVSAILVGAIVLSVLGGCGKKKNDAIEDMQNNYEQYVTLGEYKGVEYTPTHTEVTDDDIQYEIDSLLQDNTTENQIMDRAATMGDAVNIDYVGSIDGEEFDGGSTQGGGTEITLGSSGYIEGFDEQIIGHTPGDAFDVNVTFPDDYQAEDLAGKPAVFDTTLNYIVEKVEPEYNDVLVASATDYKTTTEFESAKRKELEEQNEESDLETDKAAIMHKILESSSVSEYPENEINDRVKSMIDSVTQSAQSSGSDLGTYLSYYGYTEDTFRQQVETSVKEYIEEKMIVVTIADKEKITATDEEVEAKKQELLDQMGITDIEQLKAAYGYEDEDFDYMVLYEKVLDFVYKNATQVEATATDADEASDEDAEDIELVEDEDEATSDAPAEIVDDYGTDE